MEWEHIWTVALASLVTLLIGGGGSAGLVWQIMRAQQQRRKDDQEYVSDAYRDMYEKVYKRVESLESSLDAVKEQRIGILTENMTLKAANNQQHEQIAFMTVELRQLRPVAIKPGDKE